ncbi:DUF2273 domain-containing protein [Hoyosella rhizosphaerae]|uniref:DUF2273 domain-containing protein n=1 Tax=Hoyosella rhizosphaerae TaxID=1755582 RepID=A0A916UK29_9ACTN|nr:DUF2273 domain-containing protein [Hoyosella rhizosphaerae]MBN4925438.1 DUF2273 domain-containing protein [Hoyosella rhizosphaerae]GGC75197.1 hypothetical protein GCM10011410_30630 [Hoyosella rhizosphaerae]
MSNAQTGLIAGLLLTIAIVLGGWSALLLAIVVGGAFTALGAHRDGTIDLGALLRGRNNG